MAARLGPWRRPAPPRPANLLRMPSIHPTLLSFPLKPTSRLKRSIRRGSDKKVGNLPFSAYLWREFFARSISRYITASCALSSSSIGGIEQTNLPACRFHAAHACLFGAVNRFARKEFPDEIDLIWYKFLNDGEADFHHRTRRQDHDQ
jgi:hypothetical protein